MSIKAYEIVPAIERSKLIGDKAKTAIECMESCGKNLYIGTTDCFIIHFLLEEKSQPNGKIMYNSEQQSRKYLGLKKPIVQLKAASALNRILVLCDSTLTLLTMFNLEPILSGAKVKGVTAFSINETPLGNNPFSVEICVAYGRKKSLQLFTVTEDRMVATREVAVAEPPVNMCIDGASICVALGSQYNMVNFETGVTQDLFPYENETTKPLIKRVGNEEFLLSGPSALGMFVTSAGISQRPPLQWSDNLSSVCFVFPYVLAMDEEFITVHSILDQQQKQTIPFQGGKIIGDFEGRIFVASSKEIYSLISVPFEKQIQDLLDSRRVEEALALAKSARRTIPKERFIKMYRRIQQQAGFIQLRQLNFGEAAELFKSGQLDVRELINLFPFMLPTNSNFTRSVPLLHDIADVKQLCLGDAGKMKACKDFLASFLEDVRDTNLVVGYKEEVDTALLKLYAEIDSPKLVDFVSSENGCFIQDSVDSLQKYSRHHALGLFHKYHGDNEKALQVWVSIVNGELTDPSHPGLPFVVEFLSQLTDHELVWRYVDWALEKDQEQGVKIFTQRPADEPQTERMRPETIVDYLHRYPQAVVGYLEHLVFTRKLEKEKYHTHLAVLYLDKVLQMRKDPSIPTDEMERSREKLRQMLQFSSLYRVALILGKVKETDMYAECAILYGKKEEHDKALRILVYKLKDYRAAEQYCDTNAKGHDLPYRRRLFQILLSVYLDPMEGGKDSLAAPAVQLLNNHAEDFDAVRVLQIIPAHWSIGLIQQFLNRAVRQSMHNQRTTRVERMLARGENLQMKGTSVGLKREPITLSEERYCQVCCRPFSDNAFARYPNGLVTHVQCARNKYVCPITGRLFSTKPAKK
ncbi:transforming growth factor, beta receptor associated protein 1 [Branchiostoma belcheri]|nr:transforming growth factor, beta receptor associated protein 1 [Branchiostoma belcheri]